MPRRQEFRDRMQLSEPLAGDLQARQLQPPNGRSEYFPKLSMSRDDGLLWNDAKRYLAMSAGPECTVTFPIENGMFGLDRLAKRLNGLVSNGRIGDWHPGRWIDWDHTAIQIRFDSDEDATLAKQLLSQGHSEVAIPSTGRT